MDPKTSAPEPVKSKISQPDEIFADFVTNDDATGCRKVSAYESEGSFQNAVSMPFYNRFLNNSNDDKCWALSKIWPQIRSLIPFILLLTFSGIGGLLFSYYEGTNQRQADIEHKRFLGTKTEKASIKIATDFYENGLLYLNHTVGMQLLVDSVTLHLNNFGQDVGLIKPKDFQEWTFLGSVYFSLSLSTTIGYGNIHPETTVGRVLTILYALIGIPLAIFTLNELGKMLLRIIWHAYIVVRLRLLRCGLCRPTVLEDIAEFPLTLALLLTFGWMLLCSFLFCMWEEWDYFISFYFFFMSLTTIGLGDVTPKYPSYMIGSFVLIMVGMAMVSMCFNLIELKLQSLVKKTMMRIQGTLNADNESEEEKCGTPDNAESGKLKQESVSMLETGAVNLNTNRNFMQIFTAENEGWLHTLLGKESKQVLAKEWERKAAMRNRAVQVAPETHDKSASCDMDPLNPSEPLSRLMRARNLPQKEVQLAGLKLKSTDINDFYLLTTQLQFILDDCQNIVQKREPD